MSNDGGQGVGYVPPPGVSCTTCGSTNLQPSGDMSGAVECLDCARASTQWLKANEPLLPRDMALVLLDDDFDAPQLSVDRIKCPHCGGFAFVTTATTALRSARVLQPHGSCAGEELVTA